MSARANLEKSSTNPTAVSAKKNQTSSMGCSAKSDHNSHSRAIGNLASGMLQAKLVIGASDDPYEREADRIAETVVGSPIGTISKPAISIMQGQQAQQLSRKCSSCTSLNAQEEDLQKISLQRKHRNNEPSHVSASIQHKVNASRGRGQPLSEPVRHYFEPRFGRDFSQVRIQTDPLLANNLNAKAFTVGNDIVFGRSQYAPNTVQGKRLLAHELTHTIQQSGNVIRQKPIIQRELGEEIECRSHYKFRFIGEINNEKPKDHNHVQRKYYAFIPSEENKAPENFGPINSGDTVYAGDAGGYGNLWRSLCYKPSTGPRQIAWVLNAYVSKPEPKNQQPQAASAAVRKDPEWSGRFSDFDSKSAEEVEAILKTLLPQELLMVQAQAVVRGNAFVKKIADTAMNEIIANSSDAGSYSSFMAVASAATAYQAVEVLRRLSSSLHVSMFVAQIGISDRLAIHMAAMQESLMNTNGMQEVIDGMDEYEHLINNATAYVQSEFHHNNYRKYFGKDWRKAVKALSHFSDEAIFLELRLITNNDHLRALRKAADRDGHAKVSMIISALIAAQDKTGVYLEGLGELALESALNVVPGGAKIASLAGMVDGLWSDDFIQGLIDGGLDTTVGDAWANIKTEFSSSTNMAWFIAGYYPGLISGVAKDLYKNVADLLTMLYGALKLGVRYQIEPYVVLGEIYTVLEGLAGAIISTLDAREFGYVVARGLSEKIQADFISQTPFWKGFQVGEIIGMIATEIALLFIGVGEATAAAKALRGTKLVLEIEKAVQSSKTLRSFMELVEKSDSIRLLKGAAGAKGLGLFKTVDAASDLRKAEQILVDFAKLEKAGDGALITKHMQPLEYAVLKQKVKNPSNVKLPAKPYHTKYTMEVKVGDHTYRRKPNGSWCRFSLVSCDHVFEDGLPPGMQIIDNSPLPEVSAGVRQTQRTNLRTRMRNGFDGFQLPPWASNVRPTNWNAHHVIPWEFLDHGVFSVLRNKGLMWDHNAMKNAIALPTRKGIVGAENLPIHQASSRATRGHPVYNAKVEQRLDEMLFRYESNPARLQKEVDDLLIDLKGEIEMGGWADVPQF